MPKKCNIAPRSKSLRYARLERGRHFLIVRQQLVVGNVRRRWPQLYIVLPDGKGSFAIRRDERLQDFFLDNDARSYHWMLEVARSIGLFIDHSTAALVADPGLHALSRGTLERRLLRDFALALRDGTVSEVDGKLTDKLKLFWSPRRDRRVNEMLRRTTQFMEWLGGVEPGARWAEAATTEGWTPDPLTAFRLAAELAIRKSRGLLGHLEGKERKAPHRFGGILRQDGSPARNVPSFPSKYFVPLLIFGFKRSDDDWDETAELLTHLLALGGLRQSEPFHLFVSDVQFINGTASIHFHHPQWGEIRSRSGVRLSRQEHLQTIGCLPRNIVKDRLWAGWKGMADDDIGTPAYFLPIEPLVRRTSELLKRYILVTRPALMARRPKGEGDHPYLLVSSGRTNGNGGGKVGDPYTTAAFRSAWRSAIDRLARIHADPLLRVSKSDGTTPHGLRHFYGRFLWTSGVEGDVIQRCMHHRSFEAHQVYARLHSSEISELLSQCSQGRGRTQSFAAMRASIFETAARFDNNGEVF